MLYYAAFLYVRYAIRLFEGRINEDALYLSFPQGIFGFDIRKKPSKNQNKTKN